MTEIEQLEAKVHGELQEAVEAFGLEAILIILSEIAEEKADTYENEDSANEWEAATDELETLADALNLPAPE